MKHTHLSVFTATSLFTFLHIYHALEISSLEAPNNGTISPLVPAVIIFGDSILDPGNNNVINTFFKSNFPPYGQDFIGHVPTGRFSNGKIASDFIASRLQLKELLPAYLDANLSPEDLLTGVSFASGGTGFDPLTPEIGSVIPMPEQIELFKEYREKLRNIAGDKKAKGIISGSLYVVCAGSNDVANTYFGEPIRKAQYNVPSYASFLVHCASNFVEELIQVGARMIGVVGIPPIGCVPSQRTLHGGIQRFCSLGQNQMAVLYNSGLIKEIKRLQTKHQGVKLVYIDIYHILLDMIEHPNIYGFAISTKGCCGTGDFEASFLCNSFTSPVCFNVSGYVFWDSFHPTEKAYQILADWVYSNYIHYIL